MHEILGAIIMFIGSTFMLIGAIGVVRMPDLMSRMHASTKAATFGMGLVFIGIAVFFFNLGDTARACIGILFIALTAPVGSHVIARAAYFMDIQLWEGTVVDELKEALKEREKNHL